MLGFRVRVGGTVEGGYCPGGYCPGGILSGGILSGGMLSGGCCPGGYCPGGYCPGGYCSRTPRDTLRFTAHADSFAQYAFFQIFLKSRLRFFFSLNDFILYCS